MTKCGLSKNISIFYPAVRKMEDLRSSKHWEVRVARWKIQQRSHAHLHTQMFTKGYKCTDESYEDAKQGGTNHHTEKITDRQEESAGRGCVFGQVTGSQFLKGAAT